MSRFLILDRLDLVGSVLAFAGYSHMMLVQLSMRKGNEIHKGYLEAWNSMFFSHIPWRWPFGQNTAVMCTGTCSIENFSTIRCWPIDTQVYFFSWLYQSVLFKFYVLQDGDSIQAHVSAVWVLIWALGFAVPLGMVAVSVAVSLQSSTGTCISFKIINQEDVPILEWQKAFLPTGLLTCCDNSGFEEGDFLTNSPPWLWSVMGERALLILFPYLVESKGHFSLFRVETYWST